jgi:hypothetical protein
MALNDEGVDARRAAWSVGEEKAGTEEIGVHTLIAYYAESEFGAPLLL